MNTFLYGGGDSLAVKKLKTRNGSYKILIPLLRESTVYRNFFWAALAMVAV